MTESERIENAGSEKAGPWLKRLAQIAADPQGWDPGARRKDFFGEDWILPRAFWEALAAGQIAPLAELLPRLLERPFEDLYTDRAVAEQGGHLARGAILAVLAACRFAQRREPAEVVKPLRQAAGWFDRAWPAAWDNRPAVLERDDPCFAAYAARPGAGRPGDAGPADQTVGFWTAWDLFDRLLGPTRDEASGRAWSVTALPGRLALPCRTARLPLVLADLQLGQGKLALLTVTLVRDNGCAFCPDPMAMGLAAVQDRPAAAGADYDAARDPHNLHDSMQQVWRWAGLPDQGYRGRWSWTTLTAETVQGLPKPGGADPLIVQTLRGRSAEAAVCCALWSARGGIPGEPEQELPLDRHATVTAQLAAGDGGGDRRQLRLAPVEAVQAKSRAARGQLQLLVVADRQPRVAAEPGVRIVSRASVGAAFECLLGMHRHVANYQDHVAARWQANWTDESASGPGESASEPDKPPFLESQRIELLTETENPRAYLQPAYFRSRRRAAGGPGPHADSRADPWADISRDQFLGREPLPGCDLRRAVVTTDAGLGKTSNLEWAHWQINGARDGRLALFVPVNELPDSLDRFLPETLVRRFRCLFRDNAVVPGNTAEKLPAEEAELILRRLRDQGRLVLLFDALDQTGAASAPIATLAQIASSDAWRGCQIVLSGRPHALVQHWDTLLANRGIGWRFLQVDEFDRDQQERYLGRTAGGQSRYGFIRPEAHEILGTPRVLRYLRGLTDAQLGQVRTPSDVYWKSLRHLVSEGMQQSPTARSMGLSAGAAPPSEVLTNALRRALGLLGAIAFEMTCTAAPAGDGPSASDGARPQPNFDQIAPGRFGRFVDCVVQREQTSDAERKRTRKRKRESTTEIDIDRLATLNGILEHGFFDTDQSVGLRQILWRNPSLQEFCAAYWMSQFCLEDDVRTLAGWLHLPDDPLSEAYYWIWRYAAEMPAEARDPVAWPRAMSPLYHPGDGQTARRSNEMIYRSWPAMQQHARQDAAARKILDDFQGEFERIKSGQLGTPDQQRAAAEFAASFVPLKGGTFLLGRPKDKPVPVDEEYLDKVRAVFAEKSPEQMAQAVLGKCPTERNAKRQWEQEYAREVEAFRSPSGPERKERYAQLYAGGAGVDDETPAQREQTVKAFELCCDPVLNCWYRLFDPQHGLRPSWYRDDYAKYSPDPDTPVIYVDWYDAWVFCQWVCWDGRGSRLPTEREWEYAAKAGTEDQHYWWDDEFDPKKCNAAGAVGRTTAPDDGHCNAWGLRDILGNVFEWCQDWYAADYSAREGSGRVSRGGSWSGGPRHCRSADRNRVSPELRGNGLGFRVARSSVLSREERSL